MFLKYYYFLQEGFLELCQPQIKLNQFLDCEYYKQRIFVMLYHLTRITFFKKFKANLKNIFKLKITRFFIVPYPINLHFKND